MFQDPLPKRVRVLVLGGGIHGVGVLHDLASRGWKDVHLIEKDRLGSGTSSRSTKLIHGGLRYLEHLGQFGMVSESLKERNFLLRTLPDLIQPIELILPIEKGQYWQSIYNRIGLGLYDFLSGKSNIARHRILSIDEVGQKVPILDVKKFSKFLSFWDAQVDDLALVRRVAYSASTLGAGISEGVRAVHIRPDRDGWIVEITDKEGNTSHISAYYLVNCLGPWAHNLFKAANIKAQVDAVNNKGVHVILPHCGLKAGLFLRSHRDGRVLFTLPWQSYTLLGTTESEYKEDPDKLQPTEEEISYILDSCNAYFQKPFQREEILCAFAGLRWLAEDRRMTLSATSRESTLTEHPSEKGMMITVYGGKLTSYRSLAEKIGDRICKNFGEFRHSQTEDRRFWADHDPSAKDLPSIPERFSKTHAG